jgi:hypothetical protein
VGNKRKLGFEEEKALINWFAVNQRTWDSYIQYCEHYGVGPERRFTPDYLRNWTHRKLKLIRERERVRVNLLAADSRFDRRTRLQAHEESLERISKALQTPNLPVRDLVMLEEQQRKVLESIAKERGEVKPDRTDDNVDERRATAAMEIATGFQKFFSSRKPPEVIEASSTVVE